MADSVNPYAGLQLAARQWTVRRLLRRSTIWLVLFGSVGITISMIDIRNNTRIAVALGLGAAAILVQSMLNLLRPAPRLLLSQGGLLVGLGIWGVLIATSGSIDSSGAGPLFFVAIPCAPIPIAWGLSSIRQFFEYRHTAPTPPQPEMQQWLDQQAAALRKARPASDDRVIELRAIHSGQTIQWKGRLEPGSLRLVDAAGVRMDVLLPHEIDIKPGKPSFMHRNRFNITLSLGSKIHRGTMTRQSLQRFQAWQQSRPMMSRHRLVPRA